MHYFKFTESRKAIFFYALSNLAIFHLDDKNLLIFDNPAISTNEKKYLFLKLILIFIDFIQIFK